MRRQIKWTVAVSVFALGSGFMTALGGGVFQNWFGVACGAVLALTGVGMAVLSLHER